MQHRKSAAIPLVAPTAAAAPYVWPGEQWLQTSQMQQQVCVLARAAQCSSLCAGSCRFVSLRAARCSLHAAQVVVLDELSKQGAVARQLDFVQGIDSLYATTLLDCH